MEPVGLFDRLSQRVGEFADNFFGALNRDAVKGGVDARTGTTGERAADFLKDEIEIARRRLSERVAGKIRNTSAGRRVIDEVKEQEITQLVKDLAPVAGIVGVLLLIFR